LLSLATFSVDKALDALLKTFPSWLVVLAHRQDERSDFRRMLVSSLRFIGSLFISPSRQQIKCNPKTHTCHQEAHSTKGTDEGVPYSCNGERQQAIARVKHEDCPA
jgi:hypothetical protein